MREYYMQLQLHIEPIISMEEGLLNCHMRKASEAYFISYLSTVSNSPIGISPFFFLFFLTELQDLSFDVITESASSSVFVFTCIYQQRYHKKYFPLI